LDRNPLIQQNSSFKRAVESDSNADTLQTAVVVPAKKKRGRPAKISRKADEGKEKITFKAIHYPTACRHFSRRKHNLPSRAFSGLKENY
jgi:hypothetical protein